MAPRSRALWILAATATVVTLALGTPAYGQLLDPRPTTTTTTPPTTSTSTSTSTSTTTSTSTSTSTSSSTSSTTTAPGLLAGAGSTTTTTAPSEEQPADPVGSSPAEGSSPAPAGSSTDEGDAPDGDSEVTWGYVPPEAQAIIDAVSRSASNSSQKLFDATQELVGLGLSPEEAIRIGFGRFPVAGVATFSHDWLFPRYGPGFRFHLGTDIFAPYGTPLRAPVDGTVSSGAGGLGGLSVKVFMDDGTYFYMAHLSALPEGFVDGMAVRTGDIVGFIGDSGNAKGGAPHVHLGIYPRGGPAVDPKPILDQMLADALTVLPDVVAQVRANQVVTPGASVALPEHRTPRGMLATALLRPLVDGRAAGGVATAVLFEAVGNPSSGGLAVAEQHAQQLAASIDWDARAAEVRAQRAILHETTQLFRLAFGPLAGLPRT